MPSLGAVYISRITRRVFNGSLVAVAAILAIDQCHIGHNFEHEGGRGTLATRHAKISQDVSNMN